MRIMKFTASITISIILILVMVLSSCKPRGPLTPEDAFNRLKEAYSENDAGLIKNLLSQDSINKLIRITGLLSRLNDTQLRVFAVKFGVSAHRLKNLTPREYISIQLSAGEKAGEDVIREITGYRIIGKDIRGNRATIRVENGMELNFVREGPYWKCDIVDF